MVWMIYFQGSDCYLKIRDIIVRFGLLFLGFCDVLAKAGELLAETLGVSIKVTTVQGMFRMYYGLGFRV